jgi:hypothetical protein
MAALLDQIRQLHSDLRFLVEKDPEQEVQGTTVLTLSAVLEEAQSSLPVDSTLGDQIFALISPESIEAREPIRVADLLLVVGQLLAVLEHEESLKPNGRISVARGRLDQRRGPQYPR